MSEAAQRLGVDPSRVRRLLRDGILAGRLVGRMWLVASDDVARLASHRALPGGPLSPARAWALLDLLDGGMAASLSPVARSQVRALLRQLNGADADHWRAALRARSHVLRCRAHPAAVARLLDGVPAHLLRAGPAEAARRGVDLVVVGEIPEVYVAADQWPALADSLMVTDGASDPNLLVRLPRAQWPFQGRNDVSVSALAADLLESAEPRSIAGGVTKLNELSAHPISIKR